MTTYNYAALLTRAHETPVPDEEGESSFFSAPSQELDPNLFDGTHLRPEVRQMLITTLEEFLGQEMELKECPEWLHMWLAGSGVSYQWSAPRGNGDLDVLFGIDYASFTEANPDLASLHPRDLASLLDDKLRTILWPRTAATPIGQGVYEVTFFINAGTGTTIAGIHPYAAYNLLPRDGWTITPPKLPADPSKLYPQAWFTHARTEAGSLAGLIDRYAELREGIDQLAPNSREWVNRANSLRIVIDQAAAEFDDVHGGRRHAFGELGLGYRDQANFRWQYLKRAGVVGKLKAIASVGKHAAEDQETQMYGAPLSGADTLLSRAAFGRRFQT